MRHERSRDPHDHDDYSGYRAVMHGEGAGWRERQRRDEERAAGEGMYYRGFEYRNGGQGRFGFFMNEPMHFDGPHVGKGPKGYRRHDDHIRDEACERLARHGQVDAREIEVTCEDGVLILRGKVEDRATKRTAEAAVEHVFGVEDVRNELSLDRHRG